MEAAERASHPDFPLVAPRCGSPQRSGCMRSERWAALGRGAPGRAAGRGASARIFRFQVALRARSEDDPFPRSSDLNFGTPPSTRSQLRTAPAVVRREGAPAPARRFAGATPVSAAVSSRIGAGSRPTQPRLDGRGRPGHRALLGPALRGSAAAWSIFNRGSASLGCCRRTLDAATRFQYYGDGAQRGAAPLLDDAAAPLRYGSGDPVHVALATRTRPAHHRALRDRHSREDDDVHRPPRPRRPTTRTKIPSSVRAIPRSRRRCTTSTTTTRWPARLRRRRWPGTEAHRTGWAWCNEMEFHDLDHGQMLPTSHLRRDPERPSDLVDDPRAFAMAALVVDDDDGDGLRTAAAACSRRPRSEVATGPVRHRAALRVGPARHLRRGDSGALHQQRHHRNTAKPPT